MVEHQPLEPVALPVQLFRGDAVGLAAFQRRRRTSTPPAKQRRYYPVVLSGARTPRIVVLAYFERIFLCLFTGLRLLNGYRPMVQLLRLVLENLD